MQLIRIGISATFIRRNPDIILKLAIPIIWVIPIITHISIVNSFIRTSRVGIKLELTVFILRRGIEIGRSLTSNLMVSIRELISGSRKRARRRIEITTIIAIKKESINLRERSNRRVCLNIESTNQIIGKRRRRISNNLIRDNSILRNRKSLIRNITSKDRLKRSSPSRGKSHKRTYNSRSARHFRSLTTDKNKTAFTFQIIRRRRIRNGKSRKNSLKVVNIKSARCRFMNINRATISNAINIRKRATSLGIKNNLTANSERRRRPINTIRELTRHKSLNTVTTNTCRNSGRSIIRELKVKRKRLSIVTYKDRRNIQIVSKFTGTHELFKRGRKVKVRFNKTLLEIADIVLIIFPESPKRDTEKRNTSFHTGLNREHHRHKLKTEARKTTERSLRWNHINKERINKAQTTSKIRLMRPIEGVLTNVIIALVSLIKNVCHNQKIR